MENCKKTYCIFILALLVSLAAFFYLNLCNGSSKNKINEIELLMEITSRKDRMLRDIDTAMMDTRVLLLVNKMDCSDGKFNGNQDELRQKVIISLGNVIKQLFIAKAEFPIKKDSNEIKFIAEIFGNKDICSSDFPTDDTLKQEQIKMGIDLRKFIQPYKDKLNYKIDKLFDIK